MTFNLASKWQYLLKILNSLDLFLFETENSYEYYFSIIEISEIKGNVGLKQENMLF